MRGKRKEVSAGRGLEGKALATWLCTPTMAPG